MTGTDNIPVKSTSILVRLLRGEFGLEKTFWLFWFFPTWLVNCIPYFTKPEWNTAIRTDIISIVWGGIILESLFNTDNKTFWKPLEMLTIAADIIQRLLGIM